jgi:hypothetical protein
MPVRILLELEFADWAANNDVTDAMLLKVAKEIEAGLVDARLGGFLLKKRMAAPGRGKRGGYRVILAHRQADRLIFLYGYAKNQREDITKVEMMALQQFAAVVMRADNNRLNDMIAKSTISEIRHEQDTGKRS